MASSPQGNDSSNDSHGFDYGTCYWCADPLDAGERFVYEMEIASWESGEDGFPEHEAVFPADGKPVEACKRCRASIIENYESILKDEEREEFERLRYARIIQFIFLVFVLTCVFMSMLSE